VKGGFREEAGESGGEIKTGMLRKKGKMSDRYPWGRPINRTSMWIACEDERDPLEGKMKNSQNHNEEGKRKRSGSKKPLGERSRGLEGNQTRVEAEGPLKGTVKIYTKKTGGSRAEKKAIKTKPKRRHYSIWLRLERSTKTKRENLSKGNAKKN